MLLDINRHSWAVLGKEARLLAALALPMMLAQIASVGVGFVDTVMAGAAGKDDLAAVALGSSAFSTVYITFLGIMTALNPMISQLFGAGKHTEVGETGKQGVWFGMALGLIGMVLLMVSAPLFIWYLNLPEHVENMLGQYLFFISLSMPAAMLHRALHAYASSLNRPKLIMWISWAALFLNIPLNYVFVYGKFGMPVFGGAGCGLASAIVFWFNASTLWLYIKKQNYFKPFGLSGSFSKPNTTVLKQIWRLGWPIGLSFFLEVSLFSFIVFLIAKFGADHVAAQQIVISLTSIIYMIPQAIGAATTVRVGYTLGKRQTNRARYISGVSLILGFGLAALTITLLITLRYPLAGMYTKDMSVITLAANILLFAAVFQLADFTQCIASYALRGYKITKAPMIVHGIAFWGFGLLPGYLLANIGMGIYGFWATLIVSLSSAAIILVWLLEKHSRTLTQRNTI
ncbi:MAG: MATE family efflux transporter [Neisseria sp.]|uniref:MATE family efflux transporter n=1 Tax=Neisseria sp. TaxID=192066 RepID=UPI0026DA840C|nr:MATE family efflux transporter [Neisseria sp.]MDO4640460.1 MATE family efflux transporter [Neisseria sp.]